MEIFIGVIFVFALIIFVKAMVRDQDKRNRHEWDMRDAIAKRDAEIQRLKGGKP